jgi:hypothetical protein
MTGSTPGLGAASLHGAPGRVKSSLDVLHKVRTVPRCEGYSDTLVRTGSALTCLAGKSRLPAD